MAVKIPIGYFVLMTIGGVSMAASYVRRQANQGEWLLPLVAVLFIALVSSQTGFTHHLRYVLPAFGFLTIMAARTVTVLPRWIAIVTIGLSLAGTVVYHALLFIALMASMLHQGASLYVALAASVLAAAAANGLVAYGMAATK